MMSGSSAAAQAAAMNAAQSSASGMSAGQSQSAASNMAQSQAASQAQAMASRQQQVSARIPVHYFEMILAFRANNIPPNGKIARDYLSRKRCFGIKC